MQPKDERGVHKDERGAPRRRGRKMHGKGVEARAILFYLNLRPTLKHMELRSTTTLSI